MNSRRDKRTKSRRNPTKESVSILEGSLEGLTEDISRGILERICTKKNTERTTAYTPEEITGEMPERTS